MKLSRKSDYALRAMMSLVGHYGQGPVSIRTLAERHDIPRKFLENIMLDMKSQGGAGRDGGFLLAKSPEQITLGQVVRHFDGILAPIACVSASHYQACSQEGVCRFRRVLLDFVENTSVVVSFVESPFIHSSRTQEFNPCSVIDLIQPPVRSCL